MTTEEKELCKQLPEHLVKALKLAGVPLRLLLDEMNDIQKSADAAGISYEKEIKKRLDQCDSTEKETAHA